jgi:PucR C-terminal helix-turn-helix domain
VYIRDGAGELFRPSSTRATVGASLRSRRHELEQAALTKIREATDAPTSDAEYAVGLRDAIAAALDCAFEVLEGRSPDTVSIPPALLLQARLAARVGVSPEAVVRRYTAGHTLFNTALVEQSVGNELTPQWLTRLLAEQGALLDRVLVLVSEEFRLEAARREAGSRQDQLVRKLLADQLVGTAELSYELDAWHIGVVASGPEAAPVLKGLAKQLDRRTLFLACGEETVWAWFGGHRRIGSDEVVQAASPRLPAGAFLAVGEPEQGLLGWRLTNRQARALLPLVRRVQGDVLRYADYALLASMVQDDLLTQSMHKLYLAPLESERDGGKELHRTLSAYFASHRNVTSAATVLGVQRKTVSTRLERVEDLIGRPLSSCFLEIEAAVLMATLTTGPRSPCATWVIP